MNEQGLELAHGILIFIGFGLFVAGIAFRQGTEYKAFKCVQCGALLLMQKMWTA